MLDLPQHIHLVFILTTLMAFVFVAMAGLFSKEKKIQRRSNAIALVVLLWLIFQSTLSLNKWYMDRNAMPPHMLFPLITSIVVLTSLFIFKSGQRWIDGISLSVFTWIHVVRLPVELCLFWLATQKQLPWSMTFEGYNYDIIFGITAPVMALLYFNFKKISKKVMLIWNVLGLISVLMVIIRGIGAFPSPVQLWDFSQPNYAMMHFPFIWLPAFLVPVVILAHLTAIRRLRREMRTHS